MNKLPEWDECKDKVAANVANCLERFIYENEPAGKGEADYFRSELLSIINNVGEITKGENILE